MSVLAVAYGTVDAVAFGAGVAAVAAVLVVVAVVDAVVVADDLNS